MGRRKASTAAGEVEWELGCVGFYSKLLEGFKGGVTWLGFSFQKICLLCGQQGACALGAEVGFS